MPTSDYIKGELDGNVTALNKRVCIRKVEDYKEYKYGEIVLPKELNIGFNLTKGVVESIGSDAVESGLKVGMTVLYDHFSAYGLTHPLVVVDVENIIGVVQDEEHNNSIQDGDGK